MKIEIWSDIACPWCYLAKRRFEKALAEFERRGEVEVVWRSFELDPDAPPSYGVSMNDLLVRKYGVTPERAAQMNDHMEKLAGTEGLEYRLHVGKPGNTFDAHRLIHFARSKGKGDQALERIMRAYFGEGEQVSDREVLERLASEAGLDRDEVRVMLAGSEYAAAVRDDEERAQELGINGVPFFLIDGQYAISGAQPAHLILQALREIATPA